LRQRNCCVRLTANLFVGVPINTAGTQINNKNSPHHSTILILELSNLFIRNRHLAYAE